MTSRKRITLTDVMGPTYANARRGRNAKAAGQTFEELFQAACHRFGVAVTRIPDGCKQVAARRLIRVKSPWDFVCSLGPQVALLDTKTSQAKSFAYSQIDPDQVRAMMRHAAWGVLAGYVAWTRANQQVFFIPAPVLDAVLHRGKPIQTGSFTAKHPHVVPLGQSPHFRPDALFSPETPRNVPRSLTPTPSALVASLEKEPDTR